jgi:hypothetical protein
MIIGFDFDNTIINYSHLFNLVAKKKKIINKNLKLDKKKLKNYLIRSNKHKEWTIIQGEVYGKEIMKAKVFEGFNKLFRYLIKNNVKVYIVSHKTKYPYSGKKINLRNVASRWIKKNIIKINKDLNFTLKNVYFENSITNKIKRIISLKCNIFVDDLPVILNLLPETIDKYLFNYKKNIKKKNIKLLKNWEAFYQLVKNNG